MNIYIPDNIRELPFIDTAILLLEQFNEDYSDWGIVEEIDTEVDPVRKFITLFYKNIDGLDDDLDEDDMTEEEEETEPIDDIEEDDEDEYEELDTTVYPNLGAYMTDLDGVINYIAENFYMVKGTPMVLVLLKKFGYLTKDCTYKYDKKNLNIVLWAKDNEDLVDLYCSELFLSCFREFLSALLYFEKLEIKISTVTVKIDFESEKVTTLPEHKFYQIKYNYE
jgi:hypothetical protein